MLGGKLAMVELSFSQPLSELVPDLVEKYGKLAHEYTSKEQNGDDVSFYLSGFHCL